MTGYQSPSVRIVLCTCADQTEAERIGQTLVESELAACVNLITGIHSIYRWQGKVESATEVLLLIKTSTERVDEVEKVIVKLHSYALPEFLVLEVSAGSEAYVKWLLGSLK